MISIRHLSAALFVAAGMATSTLAGAQTALPPAGQSADAAPTGSPTNATATVSPSTVADATTRTDDLAASDGKGGAFGLSLGTSIASGSFGSGQGSRLWSTALGVRYAVGTLRLTASVPYLDIRSRGLIFSGIDSTPVIVAGRTSPRRVTNRGIGDATFGAAYTLPTGEGRPEIELSGRIKLPTAARSDQLSTGKTDYSAGLQITQSIGRFAPFASVTYRIFGDPDRIDLRNGFAASAGTSVGFGSRTVALFSYHYARAASALVRDSHELFAAGSTRLGRSPLRATVYATAGISSGAAAKSGGLSIALDF